jgi:hypothetical protein
MDWKNLKLLKRNGSRLLISLLSLGALGSCAKGLDVVVCVVDSEMAGFQCAKYGNEKGYFLSLQDGKSLQCASPAESEEFLKQCKQHNVLPISACSYDGAAFLCMSPGRPAYKLDLKDADNYVCISEQDRRRISERCR